MSFIKLDLMKCPTKKLEELACGKAPQSKQKGRGVQVIVADPPWDSVVLSNTHSNDTYQLLSEQDLLRFFRKISKLFVPTAEMPVGDIFIWFTNDKFDLAVDCLRASGYEWIGMNSWHKACIDGRPMKMSPYRGNTEFFLVGRKQLSSQDTTFQTSRGIVAPPFSQTEHSSKPVEFYTEYLPFHAESRSLVYGRPWSQVRKCDFFTRHSQEGFVSFGNEYVGPRLLLSPEKLIDFLSPSLATAKKSPDKIESRSRKAEVTKTTTNTTTTTIKFDIVIEPFSLCGTNHKKRARSDSLLSEKTNHKMTKVVVDGKWDAFLLQNKGEQALVKWALPQKGYAEEEWVDKDCIEGV